MNGVLTEIVLVIVTITTGLILLYPFQRGSRSVDRGHSFERAVYRNQLKELERDRLMGLFSDEQADYVRAEIARRLFAANDNSLHRRNRLASHRPAFALIVLFLGAALPFYLSIGRPDLPSFPYEREASVDSLHPVGMPADTEQMRLHADGGNVSDPTLAPTAAHLDGLAETLMAIAGGVVTEDVRKLLERSLSLAPNNPRARFYIALSMEQAGKKGEARAAFEALARQAPPNAPWLPLVNHHISQNGGIAFAPTILPPDGLMTTDDAVGKEMSNGDRQRMIRGMVGRLDARLGENPNDFEGWMRLIRSYVVLNDHDRASAALKTGLVTFEPSGQQGKQLLALAKELGISMGGSRK